MIVFNMDSLSLNENLLLTGAEKLECEIQSYGKKEINHIACSLNKYSKYTLWITGFSDFAGAINTANESNSIDKMYLLSIGETGGNDAPVFRELWNPDTKRSTIFRSPAVKLWIFHKKDGSARAQINWEEIPTHLLVFLFSLLPTFFLILLLVMNIEKDFSTTKLLYYLIIQALFFIPVYFISIRWIKKSFKNIKDLKGLCISVFKSINCRLEDDLAS